jgi:hypothetical protein
VLGTASGVARKRLAGAIVAVLLGTAVLGTAGSFPRSIGWTAWPFRPGYAMVTDSNVDWGQGLYALRAWSASRDPWVAYFGPRGITTSDIPAADRFSAPRRLAWMAGSPPR